MIYDVCVPHTLPMTVCGVHTGCCSSPWETDGAESDVSIPGQNMGGGRYESANHA